MLPSFWSKLGSQVFQNRALILYTQKAIHFRLFGKRIGKRINNDFEPKLKSKILNCYEINISKPVYRSNDNIGVIPEGGWPIQPISL